MERLIMKIKALIPALTAAAVGLVLPAVAQDKLTVFTWSGYELPDFNKSYVDAHAEGVDYAFMSDDQEGFTKVKAGFKPDIAHPCSYKIAAWREAGLIQPIDTRRLAAWNKIFPIFRNMPDIQAGNGTVWMVPYDWGNVSVVYRTDLVAPNAEMSWSMLWDPQYAGRLASIDAVHDTPLIAAVLAGVDPFGKMSDEDLSKVADKLRTQRSLLASYSSDPTSVQQALASGELVAAMAWNDTPLLLKKQGVPVEYMNPKEGMLTWSCGFVLLKDSQNIDDAYDFINSRLEAASGKYLIETYGYGPSNSEAFQQVSPETLESVKLPANPEEMLKKTIFLKTMQSEGDLNRMFEQVKAGG